MQTSVLQRLKPKLGAVSDEIDYDYMDNNLVKLQIYFKDIVYKDYTESSSYSVSVIMCANVVVQMHIFIRPIIL